MSRLAKILYIFAALSLVGFFLSRILIGFWVPFLWLPLGLMVAFIFGGLFVDRMVVGEFLKMRTTKHGMNMGAMILLFFVGLIAVNYIGVKRYKTFDFSVSQINTLSPQSVKLVKSLNEELLVRFFYKDGVPEAEQIQYDFRNLVRKYQDESPNIRLEFIELNRRPDLAEQYGVREGGGVVFMEYQGRKNRIDRIDEQEFTSALVNVTREGEKVIYFTSGHGEMDLNEANETHGLNALKGMLEGNRYKVQHLSLLDQGEVPEDADVVAIIGPRQNFLGPEIEAIRRYLEAGGSLLAAIEPGTKGALETLMTDLGLKLGNNYVANIMKTAFGDAVNPEATPVTQFSNSHQITQPFGRDQFAVLRLPQSISVGEGASEDIEYEELMTSNDTSIAFDSPSFDKGQEQGPFALAYTVEGVFREGKEGFRAVVYGDSDFLSNQLLYQNLNRDLALNSISYLAQQEDLISIAPREIERTEMSLTENKILASVFGLFIPLPVLLFITALVLWFRRRHA